MTALLSRRARRYQPPGPLPFDLLREIREPYGPDPYVFGPGLSLQRTLTAGYAGDYRHWPRHDVTWRGDQPCFICAPEGAART